MDSDIRRIPVFVFPTSLVFYLNARHTHKQLLTLYNPYDFPVRFVVKCNSPNKYHVTDPEGHIGPQMCVDLVIRHAYPIAANCNVRDRFCITMYEKHSPKVIGRRLIDSKLLQEEPDNNSNDGGDNFHSLPQSSDRATDRQSNVVQYQYPIQNQQRYSRFSHTSASNYLAIVIGIVSIAGLLLPTREEAQESTPIPAYLHISVNLKLVFAYVLGLVSMVVFRP